MNTYTCLNKKQLLKFDPLKVCEMRVGHILWNLVTEKMIVTKCLQSYQESRKWHTE